MGGVCARVVCSCRGLMNAFVSCVPLHLPTHAPSNPSLRPLHTRRARCTPIIVETSHWHPRTHGTRAPRGANKRHTTHSPAQPPGRTHTSHSCAQQWQVQRRSDWIHQPPLSKLLDYCSAGPGNRGKREEKRGDWLDGVSTSIRWGPVEGLRRATSGSLGRQAETESAARVSVVIWPTSPRPPSRQHAVTRSLHTQTVRNSHLGRAVRTRSHRHAARAPHACPQVHLVTEALGDAPHVGKASQSRHRRERGVDDGNAWGQQRWWWPGGHTGKLQGVSGACAVHGSGRQRLAGLRPHPPASDPDYQGLAL